MVHAPKSTHALVKICTLATRSYANRSDQKPQIHPPLPQYYPSYVPGEEGCFLSIVRMIANT